MYKDNVKSDHAAKILLDLERLSVASYLFQSELASSLSLYPTDLQALHVLGRAPDGLLAGEMASALKLTSGATTALIDRLEGRGFVERQRQTSDRRRVTIRLLTEGLVPLRAKYRAIDEHVAQVIEQFDAEDLQVIAAFLARIVAREKTPPQEHVSG